MRRSIKISAWVLGGLGLLMLSLGGALLMLGNTESGRAAIERLAFRLTRGQVTVSGLSGSNLSHVRIEKLELRDAQGLWLTAERIVVDWSPLAWLQGRLQVDNLQVAQVGMLRLPLASSANASSEVSIPRIDVGRGSIDRLHLSEQLAGAPATLAARGSAHLRSLHDMAIDASAQRIDGDGDYQLHLRFDLQRMDALLQLHEPAGGPLENILTLPGLGALTATLKLSGPRSWELLEVAVQAGSLSGHAQGSLNLSESSADLDFAFDAPALNPRPDLGWERAAVRGSWHGRLNSPAANGHLEVSGLRIPGGAQIESFSADIVADLGKAALHALAGGVQIPGPQPRLLKDDPIKIDASMRLDDPARRLDVAVAHKLFSLRAQALLAGKPSATAELRLPNLRPFGAIAGLDVRGSAVLNAQLADFPAAPHLQLDAAAALEPGTQIWAAAVGDRARLQLSATLKDQALMVDDLKFSAHAVAATAKGTVGRGSVKGRWDIEVTELGTVAPILAGTLKASGSIDGPMSALNAEALMSATASVRGTPSGVFTAHAKLMGWPANLTGSVAAQGAINGSPLEVQIALAGAAAGSLQARIHHASWKSVKLDGDITMAAGQPLRGKLGVIVANLNDLQNLLGVDIAGSLQGTLALQPDEARTRIGMQLDAQDVVLARFAGSLHVSGDGFSDSFGFNASARARDARGVEATLAAKGNLNLDAATIAVSSALLSYQGENIRLLSPAHIDLASGVSVDVLKLGAQQAVLVIQGRILPTLSLRASLHGVGPPLVNAFVPEFLASGSIEAHADLEGSVNSPTGAIELTATGLRRADDAALGLPLANLRVKADLRGHTADIDARLDAGFASQLHAVGALPIAFDGAVDVKVGGKFDVGMINPFLEARGLRATGQLDIDAGVTGSVADPQITGTLKLTRGSMRDYVRGISLSDITAEMSGSEGTLKIKTFTASAAPGELSMSGSVGILQPGWPVELQISARNAQPIIAKLFTANFNADLRLAGTARERVELSGKVHLNHTVIGIPSGLPPNVAVLDVRRRGKKAVSVPSRPLIVSLDVEVQAPQEILVQGRGLDAEMGGELHIGGTVDTPLVSGGFDLQRGSFSLGSSRLNFTSGRVGFNGLGLTNKIDPSLDFTAQATVADNTTAIMHITGVADAPVFEFSSIPAMPQDEIMGYLLFGVPVSQLSAIQMAQIGYALASLSGIGGDGGLNPLVKLQKSLGLDRLTFGSATTTTTPTGIDNSGASIEAGRYISKHIYIEAKQTTAGTSQVGAVVDLTKHLKLQTRLGNGTASIQGTTPENDPGSSIGLLYQFEY
ncbi:MAG TPA: translocation/assembly module TamB domain-containing protein [Steroidobacteraceae bacterium]|nr:translocation/assembly module TamB domain-containing protein [Steroidobacteraceae bacterium]